MNLRAFLVLASVTLLAGISSSRTQDNLQADGVWRQVKRNGSSSSHTAIVTAEDNVAPTALCKDITTYLDENGEATITPEEADNGSWDAYGIASLSLNKTHFDCDLKFPPEGIILTVTDNNNNVSSCQVQVSIIDNIPPVLVCKDIVFALNENGSASVPGVATLEALSDNCELVMPTTIVRYYNCSHVGATQAFSYTVTDEYGNSTSCFTQISIVDNTAPTAVCQDITVQLDANGGGSITPQQVDNGSGDACGIASLSLNKSSFSCSDVGTNIVALTVADVNGNSTTCNATVTTQDNVAPIAVCQDATVRLDADGSATLAADEVDNGSSDACGIADRVLDKSSFDCSDMGVNLVTLTVTDVNGNQNACTTNVNVEAENTAWELAPNAKLWPPDYSYQSFAVSDMVNDIVNLCDQNASLEDVWIDQASSDEAEDAYGTQDGNTLNDILISADCRSVQLRREKMGGGNGRVYTVTLAFQDASGSISYADYKVQTPKWAWGWNSEAVDDGPVYSVSCSGAGNTAILSEGQTSQTVVPPSRNIRRPDASLEVYPNPFHSETNLKIHLSETAFTTIQVFNLQGQLIRQLHSASLEKGEYRRSWNGTDAKGAPLPSGIYLIQLRIGETILNKKVMLQRF